MQFVITGKVIRGDGYGRKIGFPTVNLDYTAKDLPPDGVYAGKTELEGEVYKAGIVIGPNKKVEAHVLGYNGDAYGKVVAITVNKFLREFKKFDTEKELIKQIEKDLKKCLQA